MEGRLQGARSSTEKPICPALTIAELITESLGCWGKNETIPSFGWEPGHCLQDPAVFLKCDGGIAKTGGVDQVW